MNLKLVSLVAVLCVLSLGAGFGIGVVTGLHTSGSASSDPYKYCFKVYWNGNQTGPFGMFGNFIPPGYYAICRVTP